MLGSAWKLCFQERTKPSVIALLEAAAPEPTLRAEFDKEAQQLTNTGDSFGISHSATTKVALVLDEHADYLFPRLFALIWLLLRIKGRGG